MPSADEIRDAQRATWAGLSGVSAYEKDGKIRVPGVARFIVGRKWELLGARGSLRWPGITDDPRQLDPGCGGDGLGGTAAGIAQSLWNVVDNTGSQAPLAERPAARRAAGPPGERVTSPDGRGRPSGDRCYLRRVPRIAPSGKSPVWTFT